jgi:hypothetical protein
VQHPLSPIIAEGGAVMEPALRIRVPESVVNIDHFPKFNRPEKETAPERGHLEPSSLRMPMGRLGDPCLTKPPSRHSFHSEIRPETILFVMNKFLMYLAPKRIDH